MLKKVLAAAAMVGALAFSPATVVANVPAAPAPCTATSCPDFDNCMIVCWKITGNHERCVLECQDAVCDGGEPPIIIP